MKELKKIDIKLYQTYYLDTTNFNLLWENDTRNLDILERDKERYLYIKILKGTDFAYAFTIIEDEVYYHGIVNLFIVHILTIPYLHNIEYNEMLEKVNEAFGETLAEAFTNKKYIYG